MSIAVTLSGVTLLAGQGFAAETITRGAATETTQVIFILDTPEAVQFRTHLEDYPPAIILEFPGQAVAGSLPERSVIQRGVVSEIRTYYRTASSRGSARIIDSLRVQLTGPYRQRIRTSPGRIMIDIEHPVGVTGKTIEIGLRGGTIISGLSPRPVTERFRAMQAAMAEAQTSPWGRPQAIETEPDAPQQVHASPQIEPPIEEAPAPPGLVRSTPALPAQSTASWPPRAVAVMGLLGGLGLAAWGLRRWRRIAASSAQSLPEPRAADAPTAGVRLIEQLVWRAFERQGYQLAKTVEVDRPPGTMRIITKAEDTSALFCLDNGPYVEKQTVEECLDIMRQASLERGFIVISGSFTVPAQRRAHEAHVALIGRRELMELLGSGATTEYISTELKALQAKFEESAAALVKSTQELELIRRQRNEASWGLGEERAKWTKAEADTSRLLANLQTLETERDRGRREMEGLQKQWEETQWYLGEAKARIRFFEEQVNQLQEVARAVEASRQERDEAVWQLGKERMQREEVTAQLQALTTELKQSVTRERAVRDQLDQFKEELDALRAQGERREARRVTIGRARVELRDLRNRVICSGPMQDLSGGGVGFAGDRTCALNHPIRIALRLPGRSRVITSTGRLVWQRQDARTTHYRSGCRFVGLSAVNRACIERTLQGAQP